MKLSGARRVAEALSQRGAVPENGILDVGCGASSSNEAALPSLVPTVASSAWTSKLPLAMTKGRYENAVIGNLDDPLALDTRLENVGATGASPFASVLDASPLNVGMEEVVRWKGIGRASKMVNLGFAFPLETRVVLWTSRIAITASEATEKTEGY